MQSNFVKKVFRRIGHEAGVFFEYLDFLKFRKSASSYMSYMKSFGEGEKSLLIVSGRGMNVVWAQIWSIYSVVFKVLGYKRYVLTLKSQPYLHRYYSLLGIELIYLDDLNETVANQNKECIADDVGKLTTYEEFRGFFYKEMPVGQISLSTFSRYHGTGRIRLEESSVLNEVREWANLICATYDQAEYVYKKYNIQALFFTEVFMEEYGGYYYAALGNRLNVVRFAGTVRDNAIIVQHLNKENDRTHHASISTSTWNSIKQQGYSDKVAEELQQNFSDRYSKKWHRSSRNHPDTEIVDVDEAKKQLGIKQNRKVAIVFSHILYDTLFFFGTDLYDSYADWLINTIKVACKNDSVDWIIKVHPSNIWRGELDSFLNGQYEEERLIQEEIGELPDHVRVVGADTKINPLSWFQLGDYCITVRGTSGLEMATFGKMVITAGTGRYDHNGFTLDSESVEEYESRLMDLGALPELTKEETQLAKLYAHALFVRKPFEMYSMNAQLKTGKNKMTSSDDIIYIPKPVKNDLPADLKIFKESAEDVQMQDLLS
jgi:hypothetical protein